MAKTKIHASRVETYTGAGQIVVVTDKANRVSFGYRKIGRMAVIAVSYCSRADKFKHQTGKEIIYHRLNGHIHGSDENVIALPIGKWDDVTIQNFLFEMFVYEIAGQ